MVVKISNNTISADTISTKNTGIVSTRINFKANPNNTLERTPNTDSLNLSSKDKNLKIQNILLTICGLAIATTCAVCGIKKHKTNKALKGIETKFAELEKDLPKAQKTFKEVFLRNDLTEKEAQEMLNRYKEVEKLGVTSSKEEYIKAVFEEAKRNFGFEKANFNLEIVSGEVSKNGKTMGGAASLCNRIEIDPNSKIKDIQKTMHHELRHMKQNYYAVNYDNQRYKYALAKDIEHGDLSKTDYEEVLDSNLDDIKKVFNLKSFSKNNVPKELEQYAKQCLEGRETYVSGHKDFNQYYNSFVEVDARHAGDLIDTMLHEKALGCNI